MASTRSFAAALALLGLAACGGPTRIAEVQDQDLYDAAFAEPRFDRAPRGVVDFMRVDPKLYGFDASTTGGPWNNVTFDADVCEVGGRRFLFVTRQLGAVHSTLGWLEIGRNQPLQPLDDRIELPLARQRLVFDVEAVPGGLVVLHENGHRVIERRATLTADGLAFAPARTLTTAAERLLALQLTKTDERLFALWTTCTGLGDCRAYLSSTPPAEVAWTEPRALGGHGNYTGARMAAGDRDLYVAWPDDRWRWRKSWFTGYQNDGKACVIVSRDGGRSFTNPVVLNDPDDFDDVAEAVDLVVGRGGLAVYWRIGGQPNSMGRTRMWAVAALDFDLTRMHRAGKAAGGSDRCR